MLKLQGPSPRSHAVAAQQYQSMLSLAGLQRSGVAVVNDDEEEEEDDDDADDDGDIECCINIA